MLSYYNKEKVLAMRLVFSLQSDFLIFTFLQREFIYLFYLRIDRFYIYILKKKLFILQIFCFFQFLFLFWILTLADYSSVFFLVCQKRVHKKILYNFFPSYNKMLKDPIIGIFIYGSNPRIHLHLNSYINKCLIFIINNDIIKNDNYELILNYIEKY